MIEPLRQRLRASSSLLAYAALAAVVFALFSRVLGFPFIAFDDAEFIVRNPQVTDPWSAPIDLLMTPRVGYIVPVSVGIEALLFSISHGSAWSFHAAALVLHAIFALQVIAFARQLGVRLSLAFGAALVFAVHPLVAQPVSWAVCLKDLLMANFALGATRVFVGVAEPTRPNAPRRAVLAIALALLAMLAKPSAALIGVAWLAYAWVLGRDRRASELANLAPRTALVTTGIGVLIGLASRYSHDAFLGTEAATTWTPSAPLIVLARQVMHVVWPGNLLIVYPPPDIDPMPALMTWLGVALLLVGAWLCIHVKRAPAKGLVFALALAVYMPTSDLLPFARAISDSYAYVPLACACIGAALCLEQALATRGVGAGIVTFALGVAFALAASTNAQLSRWRGGAPLWEPVVRAHPQLALAHRLMGDELLFRGAPKLAVEPYRRAFAIEYDPRYLLEFGTILGMADRIEDAECVLVEATAYGPNRGYTLFNYAALLAFHADDYAPRYAAPAQQLLREFDRERRAGRVAFPALLEPGLAKQLGRVSSVPAHNASWPQRNCSVLAAR